MLVVPPTAPGHGQALGDDQEPLEPQHTAKHSRSHQENSPNPAGNLPIQIAMFLQGNFSAAVPGVPLLMREGDVNTRAGFKLLIPPQIHQ